MDEIKEKVAGFTPGPWRLENGGYGTIDIMAVVDVCVTELSDGVDRAEANARLIASAPELIEVARMVDAWGHGLRHHTAHESAMVKAARAALLKAEGGVNV